jgi:hypothetical protein
MLAPTAVLLLASYVGPVAAAPRYHAGAHPPVRVERGVDRGKAKHAQSHTHSNAHHNNPQTPSSTGAPKAHKSQHGHGHARH